MKKLQTGRNFLKYFRFRGGTGRKFYQPRQKIFFAGEVQETREMDEAEESQVLNNIKEDIQYKDSIHLRQDFQKLERKYRESMKFSEMYVKFVFLILSKIFMRRSIQEM